MVVTVMSVDESCRVVREVVGVDDGDVGGSSTEAESLAQHVDRR